jgi:hypothetical protein
MGIQAGTLGSVAIAYTATPAFLDWRSAQAGSSLSSSTYQAGKVAIVGRDGHLWVLNSGAGELLSVDSQSGRSEVVCSLSGYMIPNALRAAQGIVNEELSLSAGGQFRRNDV